MPAKKKTPTTEEQHLDAPATEPATDTAPVEAVAIETPRSDWQWPESAEKRSLMVPWNDHDRSEAAKRFAGLQGDKNDAEDRKKSAASAYKATIDGLEEELNRLADAINADGEARSIQCRWVFECAGKDNDGNLIRHPEMKSLMRDDTGEVVSVIKITSDERQATMALPDDAPSGEDCEGSLLAFGFAVMEEANPLEGDTPFFLRDLTSQDDENIPGDNRLEALRNAVALLESRALPNDSGEPGETPDMMEAIREDGATMRRQNGNNSRTRVPYEAGSPERAAWKAGFDEEDERLTASTAPESNTAPEAIPA